MKTKSNKTNLFFKSSPFSRSNGFYILYKEYPQAAEKVAEFFLFCKIF